MSNQTEVKEPWERPQLTIMTRSRPDEVVLLVCKSVSSELSGPSDYDDYCIDPLMGCEYCFDPAVSQTALCDPGRGQRLQDTFQEI